MSAPVAARAPLHRAWLLLLALPAFVAVWGGWVGLGGLAGFGPVVLLPGIADHFTVNLAVTLPAGFEAYAVIGLRVWLSGSANVSPRTRLFAMRSTIAALAVGCLGQVAYHVLARPETGAPLPVTVFVACLPVAILGMGAALFHMVGDDARRSDSHASQDDSHETPATLTRESEGASLPIEHGPDALGLAELPATEPPQHADSTAVIRTDQDDDSPTGPMIRIPEMREPDATQEPGADRKALIAAALDTTGEDVPAALALLAQQGVRVSQATVYRHADKRRDDRVATGTAR